MGAIFLLNLVIPFTQTRFRFHGDIFHNENKQAARSNEEQEQKRASRRDHREKQILSKLVAFILLCGSASRVSKANGRESFRVLSFVAQATWLFIDQAPL
jgi:hypothetical protein